MQVTLETILGIELVGEEIDSFISIMSKINNTNNANQTKIGFKQFDKLEFTEDEYNLITDIMANFTPIKETPEINDNIDGTNT